MSEQWIAEELRFMWGAAEAEAGLALWHWCESTEPHAYAIYRAAQDRADAAQDALARWHKDGVAPRIGRDLLCTAEA